MLTTEEKRNLHANMRTAPYIALSTIAAYMPRKSDGNQFSHMCETRDILIDYGHVDSVLHKAAIVIDLIENIQEFDNRLVIYADADGPDVCTLAFEATARCWEAKADFLRRIYLEGSEKACLLQSAGRISNLKDIGLMTKKHLIERYCDESEEFFLPISDRVDINMSFAIKKLITAKRRLLKSSKHRLMKNID